MGCKVLIIGGTGLIGHHIAKASVAAGHDTFILTRPNSTKAPLLDSFRKLGMTILEGSLDDHQSLVTALKQVEVVISTVGGTAVLNQFVLIPAIKEAGTIKRFVPSEFGLDIDRAPIPAPIQPYLSVKSTLRREIEKAQIPYTIVNNMGFAGVFLASLWQVGKTSPPRDKLEIFGDGEAKVSLVDEDDVAAYTIKAIDDPRTLNKILSVRPELISANEIVALWEKKIGHSLEKTYLTREIVQKKMEELQSQTAVPHENQGYPLIFQLSTRTAIFLDGGLAVEASPDYAEVHELYPDYKFVTVDKYLDQFL